MKSTKIVAIGKLLGNFIIFLISQGMNKNKFIKRLK